MEASRSGGLYVPPHKVARLAAEATNDKYGEVSQRIAWEKLRKHINGCVNKVNAENLTEVIHDVFQANLIRGRGLFVKALMRSQTASSLYTAVFAALGAIVNSRIPDIGELLVKRVAHQFQRAIKRKDRGLAVSTLTFIAHLVNQRVLTDVAILEICDFLLDPPKELALDESLVWCCELLKHCGQYLEEEVAKGMVYICGQLHSLLSEGRLSEACQYKIEEFFQVRKNKFEDYPTFPDGLDLLEPADRITHQTEVLAPVADREDMLDIFRPQDPEEYREEEEKWKLLSASIIGEDGDDADDAQQSEDDLADEALDEIDRQAAGKKQQEIIDKTEQETLNLRKTIYLCLMSSLNFEESVHKLLKLNIRPQDQREVVNMLIDSCSIERTYNRSLAMQAERLCLLDKNYRALFTEAFVTHYQLVHRFETNNLRNVAKFFAHLLATKSIEVDAMQCMRLTEDDTTAAGRIFIKVLMQELVDALGMKGLCRLIEEHAEVFENSLLLRESKSAARFCVNFFTAIGLGDAALSLRSFVELSGS